jgi:hypothetical protein
MRIANALLGLSLLWSGATFAQAPVPSSQGDSQEDSKDGADAEAPAESVGSAGPPLAVPPPATPPVPAPATLPVPPPATAPVPPPASVAPPPPAPPAARPEPVRPEPVRPEPAQPPRFGVGINSGLSTGVGPGFRLRLSKNSHLQLTLFPAYVKDEGFYAAGARLQHFIAYFDGVKIYVAEGGALYVMDKKKGGAVGLGIGLETGSRTHRGFSWWTDLTYTAMISRKTLQFVLPLPQGGFIVAF